MYTEARFCAADLKPGFDIISDFSTCELAHVKAIPIMRKIIFYLIEKGAGETVRVLGKTSIVNKQIINFASWTPGHKPVYVYSLQEADEKLSTMVKREGIRIYFQGLSISYIYRETTQDARIDNISVSGCALNSSATLPAVGSNVTLVFEHEKNEGKISEIRVSAEVVRVEENGFAVKYVKLAKAIQNDLLSFIMHESQKALQQT